MIGGDDIYIIDSKFISSGREDADVRMLGNGRPFVVEILNPKRRVSPSMMKAIQGKRNVTSIVFVLCYV
jgi:tRNA pseudouridine synthase 10